MHHGALDQLGWGLQGATSSSLSLPVWPLFIDDWNPQHHHRKRVLRHDVNLIDVDTFAIWECYG